MMEIIIVGAGICGLSTAIALAQAGHKVTVLESAPVLAEVGAGVQLTPVATKYFWKWGLGPDLLAHSALPEAFQVRSGASGEILGSVDFEKFDNEYGAPYIVLHRADIHRVLHDHAVKAGAEIRVNSRVVEYGFDEGYVCLANGEKYVADIIVAADGVNSFARRGFLPHDDDNWMEGTGWAAYRMTAAVDDLRSDPRTAEIVSSHMCNCFVGSRQSVMTYMVKNSKVLNIVLSHPDDVDTSNWSPEDYKTEMNRLITDWNPCVTAMISKVASNIQNWPISQVKSLPRWASSSGKFVLVGDAAHAMAFYLSMGVSMAVEDAAALVECIDLCQNSEASLGKAMRVFESVRKSRGEAVRDASLHAGNMLHLPPGCNRDLRDAALKTDGATCKDEHGNGFHVERMSYGIADRKIRDWSYAYDTVEDVRAVWKTADR